MQEFRSENGIFSSIKKKYPQVSNGKDLFDAKFVFPDNTAMYYEFMEGLHREIKDSSPTTTHKFLKKLDAEGKLLRWYTQNIDGLEMAVFKPSDNKVVQLHGDVNQLICTMCSSTHEWSAEVEASFKVGKPITCPACETITRTRLLEKKRLLTEGYLIPNVILYNESHKQGINF